MVKICQIPHVNFSNHMSVLFRILHQSSVQWKITPLYRSRSNVIYFAQKEPIKVEILRISSVQVKIRQFPVIFERTNPFFFEFYINLQCHETYTPYTFFSWNFIYFQQKEPIKYKLGKISLEQSNVWNFAL